MRCYKLLFYATAILFLSCKQAQQDQDITNDTTKTETLVEPESIVVDTARLVGSWTRTDAPYEIRILQINSDGSMVAGYFNPNSINVARANWVSDRGMLSLYVELRDDNYPGSNYVLQYLPAQDALAGKYFQAVEGVTYDIGFTRTK